MPQSIEKTVCPSDIAVLKEHLGLKPGKVIENFFDWFDPINFKEEMLELLFDAMRSECAEFWDRRSRDHFYMAVLLVFNDYKPKVHDLEDLGREAAKADVRFAAVFPRQTKEEDELFLILKHAYIRSRYEMGYSVDPKHLEYLYGRVLKLKELTASICVEKIRAYEMG